MSHHMLIPAPSNPYFVQVIQYSLCQHSIASNSRGLVFWGFVCLVSNRVLLQWPGPGKVFLPVPSTVASPHLRLRWVSSELIMVARPPVMDTW